MMNNTYTLLPANVVYNIDEQFPKLTDPTKKVGIFLSGGMESTLIGKISQELYGVDNIVYIYSDVMFCGPNEKKREHLGTNNKISKNNLGVETLYIDVDYDLHISDRRQSIGNLFNMLKTEHNIEYTLWGFTKLFFQVEVFKREFVTKEDIYRIALGDIEKYRSTIEEFHIPTHVYVEQLLNIDIPPEVHPLIRDYEGFVYSPFHLLNKSEVVDFYKQLDLVDLLYKTTSCTQPAITETGNHCGYCFNCQQRHDAFRINGTVEDKTVYNHDLVATRRLQLEEAMRNDPLYNKN
jgi:hypothetical protein